jgi:hypothetical protein
MNLQKLKDYFTILTRPSHWLRNEPTDLVWDEALNRLLDEFPVAKGSEFTVTLGDNTVWVANYPYSYGNYYGNQFGGKVGKLLPKRTTVLRLRRAVDNLYKMPSYNVLDYVKFKGQ